MAAPLEGVALGKCMRTQDAQTTSVQYALHPRKLPSPLMLQDKLDAASKRVRALEADNAELRRQKAQVGREESALRGWGGVEGVWPCSPTANAAEEGPPQQPPCLITSQTLQSTEP